MSTIHDEGQSKVAAKAEKLKGNASWRPATDDMVDKDKGFAYRKVRFDNVNKMLAQGWQLVHSANGEHSVVDGGNRVFGGERVDRLKGGAGYIYMRLPEDGVKARNEYYNARTERQIDSIMSDAQTKAGDAGLRNTTLTIQGGSRAVKQIIE